MRYLVLLVVLVLVVIGGGLAYMFSGQYDVAATRHEKGLMRWVLETTMDRSVARHAAGIEVPDLSSPAMAATGFREYREMCQVCHGAPGVNPKAIGRGLEPPAPKLYRSVKDMSDAEVFWIVKNGVRMTGMPAFGPTHDDRVLWAITAFVKQLPNMTPLQYQALDQTVPREDEHGDEEGH